MAKQDKPNILVIWGDDIGISNLSCYSHGLIHNAYFVYGAQGAMAKFVATFKDFPIIQKPNTFTVDDALRKMSEAHSGAS